MSPVLVALSGQGTNWLVYDSLIKEVGQGGLWIALFTCGVFQFHQRLVSAEMDSTPNISKSLGTKTSEDKNTTFFKIILEFS